MRAIVVKLNRTWFDMITVSIGLHMYIYIYMVNSFRRKYCMALSFVYLSCIGSKLSPSSRNTLLRSFLKKNVSFENSDCIDVTKFDSKFSYSRMYFTDITCAISVIFDMKTDINKVN